MSPTVELPDFPYRRHTVDLDGLAYAYVDETPAAAAGSTPVVLVHGNPTWSYLYRSLIGALTAQGLRALAPDHIGMGRSDKPDPADYPHTLARRIADFGRFLDTVVPEGKVSLVVHDWGGPIALGWAVEHPERLERLVLLNTAAFRLPAGKRVPGLLKLARSRVFGSLGVLHANAFLRGTLRLGVTSPLPAPVRRGYLAPYDRPAARQAVLQFVEDIPDTPERPAYGPLRRIEERLPLLRGVPTLICWGMRDFVFDAQVLASWEDLLPEASVIRFPDAGHLVLEDAGPALAELIPVFLRGEDQPGGTA